MNRPSDPVSGATIIGGRASRIRRARGARISRFVISVSPLVKDFPLSPDT